MKRCLKSGPAAVLAAAALLVSLTLVHTAPAHAQIVGREAPADVRFGRITVTQPPDVLLDGKPDRLSPGARIRNTNHLLLMSGSVVGQSLPVVYRRDAAGLIHEAWVLTPDEAARVEGVSSTKTLTDLLVLIFGARR